MVRGRKEAQGKPKDEPVYWWVVVIGMLLIAFIVIDGVSVYNIFFIK